MSPAEADDAARGESATSPSRLAVLAGARTRGERYHHRQGAASAHQLDRVREYPSL